SGPAGAAGLVAGVVIGDNLVKGAGGVPGGPGWRATADERGKVANATLNFYHRRQFKRFFPLIFDPRNPTEAPSCPRLSASTSAPPTPSSPSSRPATRWS